MAHQLGAIRFRGKVANVVGFKNSASTKSNKDFVREHVAEIANPQTDAQAAQRCKAKPAQMFYAAFEAVLNHAFKPSAKASLNRNMFMKYAMSNPTIPDVEKGEAYLPLVDYRVSRGNLGFDSLCIGEAVDEGSGVKFGVICNMEPTEATTIGAFSTAILSANPQLVEGQELTFMVISCPVDKPTLRRSSVISFVLDKTNTVTTLSNLNKGMVFLGCLSEGDGLQIYSEDASETSILAAALIISSRSGSSWRYTNSFMNYSNEGEAARALVTPSAVKQSYMKSEATRESDKILQQADNNL